MMREKSLHPILLFSVFDDEDENKLSYTDIHVQYKKLVSAHICVLLSHSASSPLLITGFLDCTLIWPS